MIVRSSARTSALVALGLHVTGAVAVRWIGGAIIAPWGCRPSWWASSHAAELPSPSRRPAPLPAAQPSTRSATGAGRSRAGTQRDTGLPKRDQRGPGDPLQVGAEEQHDGPELGHRGERRARAR